MKHIQRICLVLLTIALAMAVCACTQQPQTSAPENADYKVTVVDALNQPYTSGIIVRFLQNGEVIGMQAVDANGVATKNLKKGDYAVELAFTGDASGYYYEKTGLNVTAENTALTVELALKATGEKTPLYTAEKDYEVYSVVPGCTYVELTAGERNYVLFTPIEAGTYQITSTNPKATVGYFGTPHYVQSVSAAEVVDNTFTVSVSASMIGTGDTGTTTLVLGLDAAADVTGAVLTVSRIGAPQHTIADEPWIIYSAKKAPSKYTLPAGGQIMEFDLTAAYVNLVYNETDGFYHLDSADGPVVLVRLAKDSKYLPSFKTILDTSPVNRYFFDAEGKFVKKESYSECLLQYIENVDENEGVYPLTEDLKYIIQNRGEYAQWWDSSSQNYLFKDEAGMPVIGINSEIAWLFMCCYVTVA